MTGSNRLGIIYAIASAFFNGSFTTLFKTRKMVDLSINPIIFQLYVSLGVFMSSWLILLLPIMTPDNYGTFLDNFSSMGIIAGGLFVLAASASFQAIDYIGLALAQGIWGGVAMVVSYIWGTCVFQEVPSNTALSALSLCLLIIGVILIAFCEKFGGVISRRMYDGTTFGSSQSEQPLFDSVFNHGSEERLETETETETSDYIYGVLWACSVGIFGGSILAPLHYVPQQGLSFLPSFGCGAFLTAPIVLLLHIIWYTEVPPFHYKDALITGIISGIIFNAGNALSIVAIAYIGYGIAYPILQCAILVSGLWGIYLFKEITNGNSIFVFFVGGFTLLVGGILLAASG